MRTSVKLLSGFGLLAAGYILGSSQILSPAALFAQGGRAAGGAAAPGGAVEVSDETKAKIKAASDALKAAMDALVDENRYTSATKGVNSFTVLTGGGNPLQDLERGAVVDPETFAGLYANLATDNVAVELGRDEEGRLTYKNKVIRMYPLSILKMKYAVRSELTGEDLVPLTDDAKAKLKATAPTSAPPAEDDQQ